MQTKHVLIISAFALFVMGIGLLLFPLDVFAILDMGTNNTLIAQILGVIFIGFGLVNWRSHNRDELNLRPVVIVNLAFYLLGFVATFVYYLSGSGSDTLWLLSGLFLLMTIAFGFAYCCLEAWEYLIGKLG